MCSMFPPRFPHFKEAEALVLKRWLDKQYMKGVTVFDVRLVVSTGPYPYWLSTEDIGLLMHIRAKRIDLTLETPTEIWILEVKDVLRASGIGQLALYAYLYRKLLNPSKPLKLGLIAGQNDPSVHAAATELGIKVWIV